MNALYPRLRDLLFQLDPEDAHRTTLAALHAALRLPGGRALVRRISRPPSLSVPLLGWTLTAPVGLAAGFDKNAEHLEVAAALGFGFVEVGSVTARPWVGNPRPRLYRLPKDQALINRMGLNNEGAEAVGARLEAARRRGYPLPVLVNVAKTPDPELTGAAAIADYAATLARLSPLADGVVLNVSCPNAKDGRTFEHPEALPALLDAVVEVRARQSAPPPWLIKLSPDLDTQTAIALAELALRAGAAGIVAGNTSARREGLRTDPVWVNAIGAGGLSGPPLRARACERVAALRAALGDAPTIIGVGGLSDAGDVAAMQRAGADAVEIYTGLIYRGPAVVGELSAGWTSAGRTFA